MTTYIILAAGKGTQLQPLTLKYPKTSYKLDEHTTVLQRMVRCIRANERNAEIVVVTGYRSDAVRSELLDENVHFVFNPFYEVTNSISSLWFARDYLERENVAIVHGDAVFDDAIVDNILCVPTSYPYVLVDKACVRPGAYNAVVNNSRVLVMSKQLETFNAKYCCLTKLDPVSSRLLKQEVDEMVNENMYDQFFEDALAGMIMFRDFELGYKDVNGAAWSEVDTVNDLLAAREIQRSSDLSNLH